MRVLWVTMNASLYDEKKGDNYGGIGWIGALYNLLRNVETNIELGVVFLGSSEFKKKIDDVTFYSIKSKTPVRFKKLLYYINGYKRLSYDDFYDDIKKVIVDYKPHIIHLWGVENRLASVCHYEDVPVIAHLQGLLSLCAYTFYPYSMNAHTFRLDRFSKREWIFHNGFIFAEKEMKVRAEIEKTHLKAVHAVMGRTSWDKKVALFNNPNVKYYHVDEALRMPFYKAQSWEKKRNGKFIIYTTISDTIYKGLDVILKAAAILKEYNYFNFEWHIAGVPQDSEFVKWFETITKIKASDVNVKMLGRQSPEQLILGLQNADLYVHPSYIDNSPNSLCEAQFLGVPCCSTNVGGISSLLEDGVSGKLFPANAPFDMAMIITDCFDNDEKWRFFANNGRNIAIRRHDPKIILNQLLTTYNDFV